MKEIIEIFHGGDYSCVINNREVRIFNCKGIADMYHLLINEPCFLEGASVADRVVGKAAASLIIIGGVKRLYTDIISLSALILLREYNVEVNFGRIVPYIQNPARSGWCSLERICYNESSPFNNFILIKEFIEKKDAVVI